MVQHVTVNYLHDPDTKAQVNKFYTQLSESLSDTYHTI